jgi:hypothetical protein
LVGGLEEDGGERVEHRACEGWYKEGTFSKPSSNGRPPWTIPVGTCAIVGVIP